MSEFKKPIHEIDTTDITRATAQLPNVDIEIVHRRAPDSDSEQIFISMQAVPSFDAFGRFLRGANPFSLWAESTRLAWLFWADAARLAMLPLSLGTLLSPPSPKERSRSSEER